MTESEWTRIFMRINRMWPWAPLQPETMAEWYPELSRLDAEMVDAAVTDLAREPNRRFPPAVGELREAVRVKALRPSLFDRPALAEPADPKAAARARAEIRRKLGGAPVLEEQEQW